MPLVSDSQIYRTQERLLSEQRRTLLARQVEVSSRRRLADTSDDPTQAAWALETQEALSRLRGATLGATQLRGDYDAIDDALGEANALLGRARTLAIGARAASQNARDDAIWSAEALALGRQMVGVVNRRVRDRYLFAGSLDGVAPFDLAGTYAGNAVVREVEVGTNLTLPANLPGDSVFTVAGGVNVQATLATLATDLAAGDYTALSTDIEACEQARAQVAVTRTRQGILRQSLDAADDQRDRQMRLYEAGYASLVEVDEVRSATDLAAARRDLERTLEASRIVIESLRLGI